MRNIVTKLIGVLLAQGLASAYAQDVRVGVSVAGQLQPGVYGRIDIGNAPPPPVVYAQPIIIVAPPQQVYIEPLYLNVPPGHAKNWQKHCRKYNACGRPVYFVRSGEYDHDSYYAHHEYEHDYDRYRYEDHGDRDRDSDYDDDHGKHKKDKHKKDKHNKHDND